MSNIIMKNTYGLFADPQMAEKAAGALLDHGIKSEHISIVFPESYKSRFSVSMIDGQTLEENANTGITTTTVADAASGTAKGAGVGLAAGTLAALAAVFLPGVGLVLGGGALALAITGVAGTTAAGAIAGGVTGILKDQGIPDETIEHYTRILSGGGAMITVSPTSENVDVETIEALISKYHGTISDYHLGTSAAVMADDPIPNLSQKDTNQSQVL